MVQFKLLCPLTLLYTLQGIMIGLITISIPNILTHQTIPFIKYTYLYTILFPFILKPIHAPIFDKIYWAKLGKRKSQLILLLIAYSAFMIFYIPQFTNSLDLILYPLLYSLLIIITIDLVLDGWVAELLGHEERGYGALIQYFGLTVGIFLGSSVFSMFNSLEFCNQFIYYKPQELPLITLEDAFELQGIFSLVLAIFVYCMSDINQQGKEDNEQVVY